MQTFGFLTIWGGWLLLLLTAWGCSTPQPALTLEQMVTEPPPREALVAGDVLDVKFFFTPELNENQQMIRPDGTITLQLIGKVMAQGKSTVELKQELLRRFTPHLKKPEVEVIVRTKNDRKVYVGGEVNTPGMVEIPGELTALEAIKRAGGFKVPSADARNVLLVRQKDGKHYSCLINVQKVLEGGEVQPTFLHPHDVIYVPPTRITQANNWVEQHVNRMIPRLPFGLGLTP